MDLVSGAVFELMDYLNTLDKVGRLQPKPPNLNASAVAKEFAYHNPCHLCALGASGATIELLSKLTDVKITDINSGCCGLAGTVGLQKKNYDLSVTIAKEMTDALEKMDTEFVMTECSACKMQIEQLTNKKVYHPIKVLAQVYGLL
jgi:Fe-S oxidoreductase